MLLTTVSHSSTVYGVGIEREAPYVEFVYTNLFERTRKKLLGEEALRLVELMLADRPRRGVVERGTGGVRKARIGLKGSGKSGGGRIVYYYDKARERIWLLFVFEKSQQATLSPAERERVRALVKRLKS